jgi:hypothetical protein
MSELKLLEPGARNRATPDFLLGTVGIDVRDYISNFDRTVDLDPLTKVIETAMHKEEYRGNHEASDAWLAPRVHAALRLTRREAADRRVWTWLAVVAFPLYVRWRFPGDGEKGTAIKRFFGRQRDHAVARLWWGAELTRNGSDYQPTVGAFKMQDVPNTWFALKAFEHKATAVAACRVLPTMSGKQINRLATALDHVLTTIILDAVAESPAPNAEAMTEWVKGEFDDTDLEVLPTGPAEDPIPKESIDAAEALLRKIAKDVGIAESGESADAVDPPFLDQEAIPVLT